MRVESACKWCGRPARGAIFCSKKCADAHVVDRMKRERREQVAAERWWRKKGGA
jgi:hypothetical protein